jgi:RNA polymerase sigma-70 factor (ECF subfamily)
MGHRGEHCDEALMRAAAHGDAAAFDALVEHLRPALVARLHAIVRDAAAAEDLLQETLLRAWTRAEQWDGRGSVAAWLGRIATNLALNHLRTVRRRRETPLGPEDEAGPAPDAWAQDARTSPERRAEDADTSRRLRSLITGLPSDKREALTLACVEDLSIAEIADRLDIPEGTVKSRLYHARKWLAAQWTLRENEGKDLR